MTFFQLLAGKHQEVVNHSTAAVQAISAWELERDVGTCSRPQKPHRTISEALKFMPKCRGVGPLAPKSTGVRTTFVLMVGSTGRRCQEAGSPGRADPSALLRGNHFNKESTSKFSQPWGNYLNWLIFTLLICKMETKIIATMSYDLAPLCGVVECYVKHL